MKYKRSPRLGHTGVSLQEGGTFKSFESFSFASDFKHRPLGKEKEREKNEKQTLGKEEKRDGGGWSSVSYVLEEEEVFSLTHFGVVESHKEQTSNRWRATGIVTLQHSNNGTLRHRNVCFVWGSRLKSTPTAGGVFCGLCLKQLSVHVFGYGYTERKRGETVGIITTICGAVYIPQQEVQEIWTGKVRFKTRVLLTEPMWSFEALLLWKRHVIMLWSSVMDL